MRALAGFAVSGMIAIVVLSVPSSSREQTPPTPETPSRADLMSAMGAVRPAVLACLGATPADVAVWFPMQPGGAPGAVRVCGADDHGAALSAPVAACVQMAVQAARVPAFTRSSFSVRFQFAEGGVHVAVPACDHPHADFSAWGSRPPPSRRLW